MNARNRASQCNARPDLHDALLPREREILALWDAGQDHATIAAALGLATVTVEKCCSTFDDRPDDSNAKMRKGSAELRARILQFHPHVVLGRG